MIGIYKITNLIDNKCYIGKSIDIERRFKQHRFRLNSRKRTKTSLIRYAILKHGLDNFKFEVLKECPIDHLNDLECFFIRVYCSWNREYGYNLTLGGDGGTAHKLSDEAKKIIGQKNSTALLGYRHTQSARDNMRKSQIGQKKSQITKDKISQSSKNKSYEERYGVEKANEMKQKIREKRRLQRFSIEQRLRLSKTMKEDYASGKRKTTTKRVLCIEHNVIFDSIKEATEYLELGTNGNRICKSCKTGSSIKGLHFQYA